MWPMHGNLDVTLMLVFVGGLRQNYDKTLTKLRQSPVDENPKLSKTPLGGREAAPKGYFTQFGFSATEFCGRFVEVLSKFCRSFVEDLPQRQPLK